MSIFLLITGVLIYGLIKVSLFDFSFNESRVGGLCGFVTNIFCILFAVFLLFICMWCSRLILSESLMRTYKDFQIVSPLPFIPWSWFFLFCFLQSVSFIFCIFTGPALIKYMVKRRVDIYTVYRRVSDSD